MRHVEAEVGGRSSPRRPRGPLEACSTGPPSSSGAETELAMRGPEDRIFLSGRLGMRWAELDLVFSVVGTGKRRDEEAGSWVVVRQKTWRQSRPEIPNPDPQPRSPRSPSRRADPADSTPKGTLILRGSTAVDIFLHFCISST